jgi:hypothetical protein
MSCPVCYAAFNGDPNHINVPKSFPCTHNVCSNCLVRLTVSGSAQCPICRATADVSNIQSNIGLMDLLNTENNLVKLLLVTQHEFTAFNHEMSNLLVGMNQNLESLNKNAEANAETHRMDMAALRDEMKCSRETHRMDMAALRDEMKCSRETHRMDMAALRDDMTALRETAEKKDQAFFECFSEITQQLKTMNESKK